MGDPTETVKEDLAPVIPAVYKVPEAAKYLRIGERTLWNLRAKGEIDAVKIGRLVRFTKATLDEYLARNGEARGN